MSQKNSRKSQAAANQRIMILGLVALGAVLLVGAIALLSGSGDGGKGTPVLVVDKEKVDLGDIKLGEMVTVSFTLTNTGDGTLKFSQEPYIELAAGC